MVSFRTWQVNLLGLCLLATPAFATRTHRAATAGHTHHYVHHIYHHIYHHKYVRRHVIRGQRGIEPERAQQIQDALIKAHYLGGPASGQWDATTQAAMEKFQADHGWQTKLVPDSRALIALGLGPKGDRTVQSASSPSSSGSSGALTDASLPAPVPGTLADTHSLPN